ncbi:PTS sugar transporter subunit IIB [Xylocopilactobacillus apis]|uniref:PTS galactitol transporter subunit IIB n=1 Tax=Xylocopilactobacillus apis TaxID=2932183 RepID=A0AAU9DFL7_9LACO|nr:PTS sugar transporter subunit IIB [Xylocopilactobacillus apis]BDR57046.1 PTS galactitol transporter subunit IIB [Xylocopilactobacillus apis]
MKKMLIMCGAGHATSTIVHAKVNDWIEKNGFDNQVEIIQSAVGQEVDNIQNGNYDIVISTTIVPDSIKDKVINGVALLTGVGTDQVWEQVKAELEA